MKKLLFVVNGHSGKGQIKNKLLDIIDIMIKEGYHVQVLSLIHISEPTRH